MLKGLVSRLLVDNHSDSGSFLVVCTWLSQGEFQQEGLWEIGHLLPLLAPPEFSQLVFGQSTMGPPFVRQLGQVGLAKVGGFGQQFPNSSRFCLISELQCQI